ncbi:MAG: TatD family hydrolase [Bacteroidaceae bacterium]|nr:TatD family hydrolase [Bacteroidaceae bacterium]
MLRIIDTHSHLFTEEFDADRSAVMKRAKEEGVTRIYMPNIDETTIARLLQVCEENTGYCFPMMGLHPTSVNENFKIALQQVHQSLMAHREKIVAVGEIGLDLYWDDTFLSQQLDAFEEQVRWALELDLPIVVHSRNAIKYIYKVLLPYKDTALRGIFHSFTGDPEELNLMLQFDRFMIGVNGIVTFKKSAIPAILPQIPVERLVIETDSPYLTPVPHRGERNESSYICYTLLKIAEVLGESPEKLAVQTTVNALHVFGA